MNKLSLKNCKFVFVWMLLIYCMSGVFQLNVHAALIDLHTICVGLESRRHGSNNLVGEPIVYRITGENIDTGFVNTYARAEDLAGVLGCFETIHLDYGQYTIQFVQDGTVDHLGMSETFNVANNNKTIIESKLIEGDANGDNRIDDGDYQIVFSSHKYSDAVCEGDAGYDPRADFDEDNCVNVTDYDLWLANVGLPNITQGRISLSLVSPSEAIPLAIDLNTVTIHDSHISTMFLFLTTISALTLCTIHLHKSEKMSTL